MTVTVFPEPAVEIGAGDLQLDAWGVRKVSIPKSLFHGMFTFDIPPRIWFMYENGTQVFTSTNITSVGSAAHIVANAVNTTVLLESRCAPRYQPNRGHLFSTAVWMPNKTNDGVRDFGIATSENGVFFRLKADGLLYAVLRRAGVEVMEDVIDTSGIQNYNPEMNFFYDIQFQWRSAGNYNFYIGDPETGQSKLVHMFNMIGNLTTVSMENPGAPVCFQATRTTQDVEINVGCVDITSENGAEESLQEGASYSQGVSVNTNSPVLVVHNPLLIGGEPNTRDILHGRMSINCSKKAIFTLWTTRDLTAITGATFVAVGGGSFVETDSPDRMAGAVRATSVTISGLDFITAASVEANTERAIDPILSQNIEFTIVRGDYVVVTATSTGAGSAGCVLEWGEKI